MELGGTFQQRRERDRYRRREGGNNASDRSLSDNFTSKWYDATRGNSVAANVIGVDASFTKEAR